MEKIKLPQLSASDIGKLDRLLSHMKENKTEFVNIYAVCKDKWGDNRLLYLFFAEYLKANSFTAPYNHKEEGKYVWKQKISSRGLSFHGFKKEYAMQREKQGKKAFKNSLYPLKQIINVARFSATYLRMRSLW